MQLSEAESWAGAEWEWKMALGNSWPVLALPPPHPRREGERNRQSADISKWEGYRKEEAACQPNCLPCFAQALRGPGITSCVELRWARYSLLPKGSLGPGVWEGEAIGSSRGIPMPIMGYFTSGCEGEMPMWPLPSSAAKTLFQG